MYKVEISTITYRDVRNGVNMREVISIIEQIIAEEAVAQPDWAIVARLSSDGLSLANSRAANEIGGVIYQFLEDDDIRKKDPVYAASQTRKVQDALRDGENGR
jgi:hypothetical protein